MEVVHALTINANPAEHSAGSVFLSLVGDEDAHPLASVQVADDFRVDPGNGRELTGPVLALMGPGDPGGFV
jgi:hypothetical protein